MRETEAILRILATHPGSDKRRIARALREEGFVADSNSVNSQLYALQRHGQVRKVEGSPPKWFTNVGGAASRPAASTSRTAKTSQRAAPARLVLPERPLRLWQEEALRAWEKNRHWGVVQAVTGTGKTRVGIEATYAQLSREGKVLIVVPSRALLSQWYRELDGLYGPRVGRRGDGHTDTFRTHDVLVATVNSAMNGISLDGHEGLLVADECHRFGAQQWSRALDPAYQRRLGLSATYERGDEGDSEFLAPYFGAEPVFDIDFDRAIRDDVVAPFRLAFVGVPLSDEDHDMYVELTDTMAKTFGKLVNEFDLPPTPPGAFMRAVSQAAQGGPDPDLTWAARKYYSNFAKRRALLADNPAKLDLLGRLHPVVSGSKGTLVFTQTKTAAIAAAKCLAAHRHATAAIYGDLDSAEREQLLEAFRQGNKTVLSAPRVLDEGIDVPDADLGIILASSSGRRQMIQRMGRVLRKAPGKQVARLVIFFAAGTNEDPAEGAHEGFIDMAWEVAQASDTFRGSSATRLIRFLGAEPQDERS